jgi:hypothetical protein
LLDLYFWNTLFRVVFDISKIMEPVKVDEVKIKLIHVEPAIEKKVMKEEEKKIKPMSSFLNHIKDNIKNWRFYNAKKEGNKLYATEWAPTVKTNEKASFGRGSVGGKRSSVGSAFAGKIFLVKEIYFTDNIIYFRDENGKYHKAMESNRFRNEKFPHNSNVTEVIGLAVKARDAHHLLFHT